MDKTKLTKWFKEHQEELKVLLIMANPRNNPFTPIDPKRIMGYEKDELERFIDELTIDELKRLVKGRDWYYLGEWQGARQKVKEELFL